MRIASDLNGIDYPKLIDRINHTLKYIAKEITYIDIHIQSKGEIIGEEGITRNLQLSEAWEDIIKKASELLDIEYKKDAIIYDKHIDAYTTVPFHTVGYTISLVQYEQFEIREYLEKVAELADFMKEKALSMKDSGHIIARQYNRVLAELHYVDAIDYAEMKRIAIM